ncbi:hypothetical protein V6N12_028879 [Hibiscus sabdariffa]|uniref:Retrotransposon gag domain-containing protein n=1 Tax=Hibiscus sabdariffa TaxID=183260 RepID=A0ABR2F745_9ROSI
MTGNNPREPLCAFDPEIERTQRRLRRGIRVLMGDHNGQNPVAGQNLPAPAMWQEPPAPSGGLLIPPAQQNNQQQPARAVRDFLVKDLDGLNPDVTIPEFEAEHLELKPVMFNMINTLGQFGGSPAENARQRLKSFLELSSEITSFRQEDDEAMHEAWKQYRDLFRRCLMHGLPEWTQVSIFYNSVNTPTRIMLDASANGTLLDKPPREDSSDTILAQISALANMIKNLQKQHAIHEVKECYVKHIQPSMEEAPKLLVAKPEQHPESQHFKSAGIPKSAEAESAIEPAKAGLPAAQQLQNSGEHTQHFYDTDVCIHGKDRPVHPEDGCLYGQNGDADTEPRSCSQIPGKPSWANISSIEIKTYGRISKRY